MDTNLPPPPPPPRPPLEANGLRWAPYTDRWNRWWGSRTRAERSKGPIPEGGGKISEWKSRAEGFLKSPFRSLTQMLTLSFRPTCLVTLSAACTQLRLDNVGPKMIREKRGFFFLLRSNNEDVCVFLAVCDLIWRLRT